MKKLFTSLIAVFIVFIGLSQSLVTLPLNVTDPGGCGISFVENGVTMSFVATTAEDCTLGSCFYGIGVGEIYLFPSRLTADLSTLGLIDKVEVDIDDNCGIGCTNAFLYDNVGTVLSVSNSIIGAETLVLDPVGSVSLTQFAVSSCEAAVTEIRIYLSSGPPCAADASFDFTTQNGCDYTFTLVNPLAVGFSSSWAFSDGASFSNLGSVNYTFSSAGVYTVDCTVQDLNNPNCSDMYSETIFVSCGMSPSYCSSGSGYLLDEHITLVDFGTIYNSSGSDGYADYTSLSTDVNQAAVYPITVLNGEAWSGDQVGIWVDWNQDMDFDDPDEFTEIFSTDGNWTFNGLIAVPLTALPGPTTMRVQIGWNELMPCGALNYGETEDYTVNVLPFTGCVANAQFNYQLTGPYTYDFSLLFPQSSIYDIAWNIDGTNILGVDMLTHTFSGPGTYTIACTVSDLTDPTCSDTYSMSLVVSAPPANDDCVSASYVSGPYPVTVSGDLSNATVDCPGILDWNAVWYELQLPYTTNYLTVDWCGTPIGNSSIGIVYYNSCGECSNYIVADDYASNTCPTGADALDVYFYNIPGPGTILVPIWYTSAGAYNVTFDISENGPCLIDPTFTATEITPFELELYTNYIYNSADYMVSWDFGDGNSESWTDYTYHTYATSGYYYVEVMIQSLTDTSCFASSGEWVYVQGSSGCSIDPTVSVWQNDDCELGMYTYYIYNSADYYVSWNFGDGSSESWTDWTYHTYATSGYYYISTYIEDLSSPTCYASSGDWYYVSCGQGGACSIDPTVYVWQNDVCELGMATYYVYNSADYYVSWNFGDGSYDSWTDWTYHTYATSGYYYISTYIEDLSSPTCYASSGDWYYVSCGQGTTVDPCTSSMYYGAVNDPAIYGSTGYYGAVDWYYFTVPSGLTDPVNVSLCSSGYDTYLAVFDDCNDFTGVMPSTSDPQGAILVNDDYCGYQSQVGAPLSAGTYYVAVYGYSGDWGNYTLNIFSGYSCNVDATVSVWQGNDCELGMYTYYIYNSADYYVSWNFGDGSSESWTDFTYHTYATSGYYYISTYVEDLSSPTCYASSGDWYYVSCGQGSGCSADATVYVWQADDCELGMWTFNIYNSADYYVAWDFGDGNYDTWTDFTYHTYATSGYYYISTYVEDLSNPTCYASSGDWYYVSCGQGMIADPCTSSMYYGSVNDPAIYGSTGYYGAVDWYYFTVPSGLTDPVNVSLCSSGYDTYLAVFDDCNDFTGVLPSTYDPQGAILVNDDYCGYQSQVGAPLSAGTYYVAVYGYSGDYGSYTLNIFSGFTCNVDATVNVWQADDCELGMWTYYIYNSADYYVAWDFGDGNYDTWTDFTYHTYATSGYYYISTYVEDLSNPTCYASSGDWYYVSCGQGSSCNIDPSFTVWQEDNCEMGMYTDYIYSSSAYYVAWSFGDGTYEEWTDYTYHTYPSSGYYYVVNVVGDLYNASCYASSGQWIYVSCGQCSVDADFTWVENSMYDFTFSLVNSYDPLLYSISWDLGDGFTTSGADVINYIYSGPGTYTVTASVGDISNPSCFDIVSYDVDVLGPQVPWQYTITNSNHTILVPDFANITIDGVPVSVGDYLGVFFDVNGSLVCGGYIEYSGVTTAMTAWGDDSQTTVKDGFDSGEAFQWKIWEASSNTEYDANATYMPVGSAGITDVGFFAANGMSGIQSLIYTSVDIQNIALPSGWSIFSTYINPYQPLFDSLMSDFVSNSYVEIVKSGSGQVYWPGYGINMIGNISVLEGYQIKMNSAQTLVVEGTQVAPETTPLTLVAGWSIMSYLRETPASIEVMMSPVVTSIEIMKNGSGMVYWPIWSVNSIGNMMPGEGYQVKMNTTETFYYPANGITQSTKTVLIPESRHYLKPLNTGDNMTLGIPNSAWPFMPELGDEVSVYSQSGILIGTGVYDGENMALSLWGNDETTSDNDGLMTDEAFSIYYWNSILNEEIPLTVESWIEGNEYYSSNAISVVEKFKVPEVSLGSIVLKQNMPNPANNYTIIELYLPSAQNVQLSLFDVLGQELRVIASGKLDAGSHQFNLDVSNLANGNYFYKLITPELTQTKQLSVAH